MEGEKFSLGEEVRFNFVYPLKDGESISRCNCFHSMQFQGTRKIKGISDYGNYRVDNQYTYPAELLLKMPKDGE